MQNIPFSRPSLGNAEVEAVSAVIRSGWLTTGGEALAFEREFAAFLGVKHALAVNSATSGLHLALEATGVDAGSVVIVPSMTFTATAEVARYLGAEVCFADVRSDSLLLDPLDVQRRAEEIRRRGQRLSAIIPVHFAGAVCEMEPLRRIARAHGAALIEDAAHAFPAVTAEGHAGTLSDVGVFSFYANKTITTGEGGMVCTNDRALAEHVRIMRTHGIDRESWHRYRAPDPDNSSLPENRRPWYYQVVAPGYKYNMPDIAAAIGRVQLARAEDLHRARHEAAIYYRKILHDLETDPGLELPADTPGHAWHLYVVRIPGPHDRDRAISYLAQTGIGASVHYIPLHRMPYWRERYGITDDALPVTAALADRIMSLPLYPELRRDQQDLVAERLRSFLQTREGASAGEESNVGEDVHGGDNAHAEDNVHGGDDPRGGKTQTPENQNKGND